jgi:hypothetical protein
VRQKLSSKHSIISLDPNSRIVPSPIDWPTLRISLNRCSLKGQLRRSSSLTTSRKRLKMNLTFTTALLALAATMAAAIPTPNTSPADLLVGAGELLSARSPAALVERAGEPCYPLGQSQTFVYVGRCGTPSSCGSDGYTVGSNGRPESRGPRLMCVGEGLLSGWDK